MTRFFALFGMLILWATPGEAQKEFGAPVVKFTSLRGQGAVMVGGRGGWIVSPSLTIGGGAYGTVAEVDAPAGVPFSTGPLDLRMETFGFDAEYRLPFAAPVHLTVGAFAGGAAVHYYKENTDEQDGETDFMLLLEPTAGLERRIVGWLHLHLGASYRLTRGVEQFGLEPRDLDRASVIIAAKIGEFRT